MGYIAAELTKGWGSILFLVDLELADGDAIQDALTGAYLHCTLLLLHLCRGRTAPVSYTHLDVYKRQIGCIAFVTNKSEVDKGVELI